jgi:hypothetical protein
MGVMGKTKKGQAALQSDVCKQTLAYASKSAPAAPKVHLAAQRTCSCCSRSFTRCFSFSSSSELPLLPVGVAGGTTSQLCTGGSSPAAVPSFPARDRSA